VKRKRTYTTDDSTFASNPGNVTVNPLVYLKNFPIDGIVFAFLFIISLFLLREFPYILFVLIIFILYLWKHKQEHFKLGDSNPGVVIKVNPTLIAIATDLTKRNGSYPVVKIIKVPLKNLKIGDKVGTVALYQGTTDDIPHWSDFYPIAINCVTDNLSEINNAMASYTLKQFSDLEDGVSQLQKPYKEGLYKVHNEYSRW
jgi:hypothetical protein